MKPMLAATVEDVNSLRYPLLASPKLDGVRATVRDGVVWSRSLKPIPNAHVQSMFRHLEGYDGELIVGPLTAKDVYRQTMSGVMSRAGSPPVSFLVFDDLDFRHNTFEYRLEHIQNHYRLQHDMIESALALSNYEVMTIQQGYEGVILRDPKGVYKHGRSTLREQGMMKLKRFCDDEAAVVGFKELMHNDNPATTNELGYTERSSHQANKIPTGRLGALTVEWNGVQFDIGTGFDDALRRWIWSHKERYLGELVKFKYLRVGMKDRPRHPVFLGWRTKVDL